MRLAALVPGNAGSPSAGPFGTHATQYTLLFFSFGPLLNALHSLAGVVGVVAARKVGGTAIHVLALAGFSAYSVPALSSGTGDPAPGHHGRRRGAGVRGVPDPADRGPRTAGIRRRAEDRRCS